MTTTAVPAILAMKMRRYKEAFRAAGATTPARALRPAEAGLRETLIFHKLVRRRILVPAGDGRYYLNEARDAAVMRTKRKWLAILLLVSLVVLIIASVIATLKN